MKSGTAALAGMLVAGILAGCGAPAPAHPVPELGNDDFTMVAEYDIPEAFFVQGVEFINDSQLVMSLGQYEASGALIYDKDTQKVSHAIDLDPSMWGEGITRVDDHYFQLTWKTKVAYTYDDDLNLIDTLDYDAVGWGTCYDKDAQVLYTTDGSSKVTMRDPQTYQPVGVIEAHADGKPVAKLNELECVNSTIYANIFMTGKIAVIDPANGETQILDLEPIASYIAENNYVRDPNNTRNSVMNGIAYHPTTQTFYIFGKEWTKAFEVKLG